MLAKKKSAAMPMRFICALLLVFIGFAHKPMEVQAAAIPGISAYTLPDGTIADLCIGNKIGSMPVQHLAVSDCSACRLASSVLLPLPPTANVVVFRIELAAAYFIPLGDTRPKARLSGPSPRGPPSSYGIA